MRYTWRKQPLQLHVNEVAFRGDTNLPDEIMALNTPLEIFSYFMNDTIIDLIAEETNRAARAKNEQSKFLVTSDEIRNYLGILIFMSVFKYPNLESYWERYAFAPIQRTMTWNRFENIKSFLCFRNEAERKKKGEVGYDPLFRIRIIADELNKVFDSIPKTERLCVDEQMCSTKAVHHLRQYMPNKPHKWGVKFFVLCDSFGYAYRFEIYNGAGDNVILPDVPDLGATSNVVVRLSQTIPNFSHHVMYFDNFYTSIGLLVYLRSRGIYSLGTIRPNRVPMSKLPSDNDLKKEDRGYSEEYSANICGVPVTTVIWKDNKCVRLASSYVGVKDFIRTNPNVQPSKIVRFDRKEKKHVDVDCPQIIKEYNRHMGGVDLMDGLMGRYHIRAKTRNVMMRIFYHLVDVAIINAYLLNNRIRAQRANQLNVDVEMLGKPLQLPDFRAQVAEGLVSWNKIKKVS